MVGRSKTVSKPVQQQDDDLDWLYGDMGNAYLKFVHQDLQFLTPHFFYEFPTRGEFELATERNESRDFLQITRGNTASYYAVGSSAVQFDDQREIGSNRYREGYLDVLLARAVAEVVATNPDAGRVDGSEVREFGLVASHPPIHEKWRDTMRDVLSGYHRVNVNGAYIQYTIKRVRLFDELLGGMMMCSTAIVKEDGKNVITHPLKGQAVLVYDLGGYTLSTLLVNEDGIAEYGTATSATGVGMLDVIKRLNDLLTADKDLRIGAGGNLSEIALRRALIDGYAIVRGVKISIEKHILDAMRGALTAVKAEWSKRDNGFGVGTVIVTGGAGPTLAKYIGRVIEHDNIKVAADETFGGDPKLLPFADVMFSSPFTNIGGVYKVEKLARALKAKKK